MKKKHVVILLGLIVIICVLALVTYFIRANYINKTQNLANETLFSDSPEAQFLDANSQPVSLDSYKDTILVVNVWASWSPYTEIEFPILNEVAENFKDKGVRFLIMNRKENQQQIDRYLSSIIPYPNLEQIVDTNDFFYNGIDGYAMPETVIFDDKGRIIEHIRGVVDKEKLNSVLEDLTK